MFEEFNISAKAKTPEEAQRRRAFERGHLGGKTRSGCTNGHKWSRELTAAKIRKLRRKETE